MASEITVSLSVVGSKGGATASAVDADVVDMAGSNMAAVTQTIITTGTGAALNIGLVTIGGIMSIKNLSTTGTVYVDNGGAAAIATAPIKIKYGETALIRTNGATAYWAIADISSLVQVVCFDN